MNKFIQIAIGINASLGLCEFNECIIYCHSNGYLENSFGTWDHMSECDWECPSCIIVLWTRDENECDFNASTAHSVWIHTFVSFGFLCFEKGLIKAHNTTSNT